MTSRYERMKMHRRMQRRIQLVVEERRMSLGRPDSHAEPAGDAGETTIEIPMATVRAIGRVAI